VSKCRKESVLVEDGNKGERTGRGGGLTSTDWGEKSNAQAAVKTITILKNEILAWKGHSVRYPGGGGILGWGEVGKGNPRRRGSCQ